MVAPFSEFQQLDELLQCQHRRQREQQQRVEFERLRPVIYCSLVRSTEREHDGKNVKEDSFRGNYRK